MTEMSSPECKEIRDVFNHAVNMIAAELQRWLAIEDSRSESHRDIRGCQGPLAQHELSCPG